MKNILKIDKNTYNRQTNKQSFGQEYREAYKHTDNRQAYSKQTRIQTTDQHSDKRLTHRIQTNIQTTDKQTDNRQEYRQ